MKAGNPVLLRRASCHSQERVASGAAGISMRAAVSCMGKQLTEMEKTRDPFAKLCGCGDVVCRQLTDVSTFC
jgi:hypothetical protein